MLSLSLSFYPSRAFSLSFSLFLSLSLSVSLCLLSLSLTLSLSLSCVCVCITVRTKSRECVVFCGPPCSQVLRWCPTGDPGVDPGFWSGGSRGVLTPRGPEHQNLIQKVVFPQKLPENCKNLWGKGAQGPLDPLMRPTPLSLSQSVCLSHHRGLQNW